MSSRTKQEREKIIFFIRGNKKVVAWAASRGVYIDFANLDKSVLDLDGDRFSILKNVCTDFKKVTNEQYVFYLGIGIGVLGNMLVEVIPKVVKDTWFYPYVVIFLFYLTCYTALKAIYNSNI
jgi:hypothetical protein